MRELAEIIKEAIAKSLDGVHTGIPATVTLYNPVLQQVACQPVIAGMPVLEDVPVLWPRGGLHFLHMPLIPGDTVYLLFSEQDTGPWRLSGTAQAPALLRRHGLYAVALPGVAPDVKPLTSVTALTGVAAGVDGGPIIHVGAAGVDLGAFPATQAVALAALVDAAISAIVTWANLHVHTSAAPGSPTSPPTVSLSPPGTTTSTMVRCSA